MKYHSVFRNKIFYIFIRSEWIITLVDVRQNPGLIPGYSFLKQHSRQIPKLPESNNYKWKKKRVTIDSLIFLLGRKLSIIIEYLPAFHSNKDYPWLANEVPKAVTIMIEQ